jgi:inosose dehydratase
MSKALDFGVQSYCFREFKDNAEVAAKVREIGLNKVEVCGLHFDFQQSGKFKDVAKAYQDQGVSIVSIGVETFVGDEKERGALEAIKKTQKLSDEFGVRVGIHCHGGYMFGGQPDVLDYLIKLGSPQIGLCIDTAWCMQIGPWMGKPLEWVKRYAGRIYGIHFKDFVFGRDGQWMDTVVGQGNLDLPAFIQALDAHGFDGMGVIEYEGEAKNPVPALKNCVEAMRKIGS